jgi:hypothetical protein
MKKEQNKIDESGIDLRERSQVEEWAERNHPKVAHVILNQYDASYGVSDFLNTIRDSFPNMASK